MRSLIPFKQVKDMLSARDETMWDKVVPASRISMNPETGDMDISGVSLNERFALQPQALSLLASKLNVPASYLKRCPYELRARNVNHWLREFGDKDVFVRFDADEIRAVLSTRYAPISHSEVLSEFYNDAERYSIDMDIDPVRMVARLVTGDIRGRMSDHDLVLGGLTISNSEVGFGSLELSAFLYRVVCTNGLITRQKFDFRRVHLSRNNLQEELRNSAQHVLEHLPYDLDALRNTQITFVPDPKGVMSRINERHELNEIEVSAVSNAWERERGDRLFHVINTYTGAANEDVSIESRDKLQRVGGKILADSATGKWLQ